MNSYDSQQWKMCVLGLLLSVFGVLTTYCHYLKYHDVHDKSSRSDKIKLMMVAKELILDAFLKVRQVAGIRDDHSEEQAFGVGLIMGNIREKYRRMLETYREMRDQNMGRTFFVPPSIWQLRPIHYLVAMEQVHMLEVDIDKSIHVLETIQSATINPDPRYLKTTTKPPRWPVMFPRAIDDNITEDYVMMEKEESLKRQYREEQLLRRLGASARHTSLPRFQNKWPVEDTWRLGQYGQINRYY